MKTLYSTQLVGAVLAGILLAPQSLAAQFQAEDFDRYYDTTSGNTGGAYRTTNVDIEATSDVGDGFNVGWIAATEWLSFDGLNVPHSGQYQISARVASPNGGTFSVDLDGGNIVLGDFDVPATEGWQRWRTITKTVHLDAGNYSLGVYAQTSGWNFNWIAVDPVGNGLPKRFEAEDYVGHADTTPGNTGGEYRNDDVDIEAANDVGNGYNVGWWADGEWLSFDDLEVSSQGEYEIKLRVASENGGGRYQLKLNNSTVLAEGDIPNTGDWQAWRTIKAPVNLPAGNHTLTIVGLTGGFNLNWLEVGYPSVCDVHCADPAKGEWTLVVIPDTQHYSQNRANAPIAHMRTAFDWIVSIKDQLNIKFVQGLGDITEGWDQDWEWDNSTSAWYKLYNQVPFMPIQGNHDAPYKLNQYFPVSSFSNQPWYGGDFGGIENNYGLMTIYNEDYMFLQVEAYDQYSPYRPEGINWAKGILAAHPDRKVILATHDIWATNHIKNQLLTKYDNIVLANAGHSCVREAHYVTQGPGGGISQNFVADYQCDAQEVMLLRYYIFRPLENKVDYYTYSPVTDQFESDANSRGSFPLQQANP
mgnify:CR=1 FL=1